MENMYKIFSILFLTCNLAIQTGYREYLNKPMEQEAQALHNINMRALNLKREIDQYIPLINVLISNYQRGNIRFNDIQSLICNLTQQKQRLQAAQAELLGIKQPAHLQTDKEHHIQQAQTIITQSEKVLNQLNIQQQKILKDTNDELLRFWQGSKIPLPIAPDQSLKDFGADKNTAITFHNFFFLISAIANLAIRNGTDHEIVFRNFFEPIFNGDQTALWQTITRYAQLSKTLNVEAINHTYGQSINEVFTLLNKHNQQHPGTLLTSDQAQTIEIALKVELGLKLAADNFEQNAGDILAAIQAKRLFMQFNNLPQNIKLFYYYLLQTIRFYLDTL